MKTAAKKETAAENFALLRQNQLAGILLALAAMFLLSLLDLLAKFLGQTLPVMQIAWARYFFHFAFMAAFFWPRRGRALLRTTRPGLQWFRSLLLIFCTIAFFTAIQYMPLADAVAISFVSPLMVTALSVPLLGEAVGWRRWSAVAVGFIGAMIIVRPGVEAMHWAVWLLLAMALAYALYQITTRMLSGKDDPITTLFYTGFVGAGIMSLAVPFFWQSPASPELWLMLVALGLMGGVGMDGRQLAAALVVEILHEARVAGEGLGRGHILEPMPLPQAVIGPEGGDAGFGGDAGAGEDDEVAVGHSGR